MSRRIVALVASVLLAAVGGAVLLQYVTGADDRAMAGLETTTVLVAVKPIPAGTPAEKLASKVELRSLPVMAVPAGRVTSVDDMAGQVTSTSIEVGEQLVSARFADPAVLTGGAAVTVPKGMQQISIQLDRQRVLGGNLTAGATVGVFFSTDTRTQLTLDRVLVTDVQGGISAEADAKSPVTSDGAVLVTLAITAEQAEKIVYAAEHAAIWLSLQNSDSSESDTTTTTSRKNLFR